MNRETFDEYCRMYDSTPDKALFYDRFYDPDARFEHPFKGTFVGREAIVNFWTAGHQGIHEILKPVSVLIEGDRMAVEVMVEWRCSEDTDYLGPRKQGDVYYAECAAFFQMKNDKIVRVKMYLQQ